MNDNQSRQGQLSLKSRVFRAGGWSLAGFFVRHGIRFGSNLVMTRLLVPETFGIMAIASLVLSGLAMFSDLGLRQSAVQSKRGDDEVFLNTVWLVQIARGFLLWLLACLLAIGLAFASSAGLVDPASAYGSTELPLVIAIASFGVAVAGFESTKVYEASRHLALRRLTMIEIGTQLVAFLFMLAWVLVDRSVWALVAGSICSYAIRAVLSHTHLVGTDNRWQWEDSAFKEILAYGKWVFASSILGFLVKSGDRILLAAMVSAPVLGVYAIAYLFYEAIEQLYNRMLVDVAFPALSKIVRERPAGMRDAYYKFHLPIAGTAYLLTGFLWIAGPSLISLLYDPRYHDAGWMLSIVSVSIACFPARIAEQSFLALGMPKLMSHITLLRLIVLYAVVPVAFRLYGLEGAIWAVVSSHVARWPVVAIWGYKLRLLDLWKEVRALPALAVGIAVGLSVNWAIGLAR